MVRCFAGCRLLVVACVLCLRSTGSDDIATGEAGTEHPMGRPAPRTEVATDAASEEGAAVETNRYGANASEFVSGGPGTTYGTKMMGYVWNTMHWVVQVLGGVSILLFCMQAGKQLGERSLDVGLFLIPALLLFAAVAYAYILSASYVQGVLDVAGCATLLALPAMFVGGDEGHAKPE
eukprot:TRINITY_DN58301_c0_g1_i1.p1 TRINITY_DN58301_c0_g1~~TRINITY_DN58301_c0_g1_i1.p1  ORF type:complete len:178 (+),score=24.48 TRINITY_DN58301_c0_g1_i1:82-615(+)